MTPQSCSRPAEFHRQMSQSHSVSKSGREWHRKMFAHKTRRDERGIVDKPVEIMQFEPDETIAAFMLRVRAKYAGQDVE